jgi:hypothetical protein
MSTDKLRIVGAIITVIGLIGYAGFQYVAGTETGGTCADSDECQQFFGMGGACLEDTNGGAYCSPTCEGAADCPPGWSCQSTTDERGMNSEHLCVRPATVVAR